MTITKETFSTVKNVINPSLHIYNINQWRALVASVTETTGNDPSKIIIRQVGNNLTIGLNQTNGEKILVNLPNASDPRYRNELPKVSGLFDVEGVGNTTFADMVNKRVQEFIKQPNIEVIKINDTNNTIVYDPDMQPRSIGKLPDAENLTVFQKIILEASKTINIATDPEVQQGVKQIIREKIETLLTAQQGENDAMHRAHLQEGITQLAEIMKKAGLDIPLKTFLENGLEIYKKQHPEMVGIQTLTLESPQGLSLALTEGYVQISSAFLAIPRLAGEIADHAVAMTIEKNVHQLALLTDENQEKLKEQENANREIVELATLNTNNKIAQKDKEYGSTFKDAEKMNQELESLKAMKPGLIISRFVEGLFYILPAIPKGFSGGVTEWVSSKPITAACAIGAVIWAGGAWVLCSSLPLTVIPALAIFMAGPLAQGIKDYGKEKTKN